MSPGPLVTMVGEADTLLVVTHGSHPLPGHQALVYTLYTVNMSGWDIAVLGFGTLNKLGDHLKDSLLEVINNAQLPIVTVRSNNLIATSETISACQLWNRNLLYSLLF